MTILSRSIHDYTESLYSTHPLYMDVYIEYRV